MTKPVYLFQKGDTVGRTCTRCKVFKPKYEFHPKKIAKTGVTPHCKVCINFITRERQHKQRKEDTKRVHAADKIRANRYPEKQVARYKLREAVKAGKIQRPKNCTECNAGGKIEAHHPDYSKPLDVLFLCQFCHKKQHFPSLSLSQK